LKQIVNISNINKEKSFKLETSVTFQGRHILKYLTKEVCILATREWWCSLGIYFDSRQLYFGFDVDFHFSSFN